MTPQTQPILDFLRANPDTYFSRKEICKKAIHRDEYEANPHWAIAPLAGLVEQGQVEQSEAGHYRIKQNR